MSKGGGKSRRIRSADSATNKYLTQLRRNGYLLEIGGGGHWKIYLPCETPHEAKHCSRCDLVTTTSASPSVHCMDKLRRDVDAHTQEILGRREQKTIDCG